ncbi:hypothetical protein ACJJI3_18805 [Microbulbifer sp. ZKSA004]|uniref:hypothetical protein n=1 Tax=Microbulbifer sp. ZKSA004 TaxID=3243389 RepID=UPI00403A5D18
MHNQFRQYGCYAPQALLAMRFLTITLLVLCTPLMANTPCDNAILIPGKQIYPSKTAAGVDILSFGPCEVYVSFDLENSKPVNIDTSTATDRCALFYRSASKLVETTTYVKDSNIKGCNTKVIYVEGGGT